MKTDVGVNLVNRGNGEVGLEIGDATLVMRSEVAVRILLDKLLQPQPIARRGTPAIGAECEGGKFAGFTIDGSVPCWLVLLPGDESMPWDKAVAWAKERRGMLPSRIDQLVLFKNLKSEFKEAWYWSAEQYAGSEYDAWCQYFGYGSQDGNHEDGNYRARAVRRVPIQ